MLNWRCPGIFILLLLSFICVPLRQANGAMDRSRAIFGADVFLYANYLYLSELFQKPTAIPLNDKFCGDVMTSDQIQELKKNIEQLRKQEFWSLRSCAPVSPTAVRKTKNGRFEFYLRYLKLSEGKWLEDFKAAIFSKVDVEDRLMPLERQLFLSRILAPELTINLFSKYGEARYLGRRVERLGKASKNIDQSEGHDLIGVIRFRDD
jgi:hypothetical protein